MKHWLILIIFGMQRCKVTRRKWLVQFTLSLYFHYTTLWNSEVVVWLFHRVIHKIKVAYFWSFILSPSPIIHLFNLISGIILSAGNLNMILSVAAVPLFSYYLYCRKWAVFLLLFVCLFVFMLTSFGEMLWRDVPLFKKWWIRLFLRL